MNFLKDIWSLAMQQTMIEPIEIHLVQILWMGCWRRLLYSRRCLGENLCGKTEVEKAIYHLSTCLRGYTGSIPLDHSFFSSTTDGFSFLDTLSHSHLIQFFHFSCQFHKLILLHFPSDPVYPLKQVLRWYMAFSTSVFPHRFSPKHLLLYNSLL